MPQHTDILQLREYDRTDHSALRAYFMGLPLERIWETYYSEASRKAKKLENSSGLRSYLNAMRDHLADGLMRRNPPLAQSLRSMQQTGKWGQLALDYIAQAAWQQRATPAMQDDVGKWMKPVVTQCLSREHLYTLGELCAYIEARGPTWWRSIPRIGAGKAHVIATWLQRSLGLSMPSALMAREPYAMQKAWNLWDSPSDTRSKTFEVCLRQPLTSLDWSDSGQGKNRHQGRCQIQAHTDADVFDIYLQRFADRPHTLKSYRKEMERFLLWVRTVARTSLSDVDVSHCQHYCQFISNPDPNWIAPFAAPRGSLLWRPFVAPLSAKGIAYAQQVLGAWFEWLVDVQYLAGNPWKATHKPLLVQRIHPIHIERALDKDLWQRLSDTGGVLDQLCQADPATLSAWFHIRHQRLNLVAQCRLLRAAILLMGHTGMRVSEAAAAMRHKLIPLKHSHLHRLDIVGKRHKERFVILPPRAIQALQAHWQDHAHHDPHHPPRAGHDPLLSPVNTFQGQTPQHPPTAPFTSDTAARPAAHFFSGKDLSHMMITGLTRIAHTPTFGWSDADKAALLQVGTHGLRHTFATLGIQDPQHPVPIDLMKDLLGHASLHTTSLYVQNNVRQAEKVLSGFFNAQHPTP